LTLVDHGVKVIEEYYCIVMLLYKQFLPTMSYLKRVHLAAVP